MVKTLQFESIDIKLLMKFFPIIIAITFCLICATTAQVQLCKCKNGGSCSSFNPTSRCICPQNFIGQFCQIYAHQISNKPLKTKLIQNYTFFYFQPDEVNYYKMIFNICMTANPSNSHTIFFIESQKDDGTLRITPSLIQTSKLILRKSTCTSFETHYISVKRKENDNFRRIIVGIKVMEDEQIVKYLKVYLGSSKLNLNKQNSLQFSSNNQEKTQQITLSMSYEVYIHTSYYNTFILIFTTFLLFLVLITFFMYLRSKYALETIDIDCFQINNHEINQQRRHIFNYERLQYLYRKKNLRRLEIYMPIKKFKKIDYDLTSQRQLIKDDIYEKGLLQTCSICLMDFQQQAQIRTTPCSHIYHRDCIDSWCEKNMNCPYCRTQLDFSRQIRKAYYQFLRNQLSR